MSPERFAIDLLEVAWLAVVLTGLCFGIANLIAAIRERETYPASRFGITLLTGNLAMVAVRTAAQVAFLVAGVAAIITPGPTCGGAEHNFQVIETSLFIAGAAVSVNSIIGWDMRRRLNHLLVEDPPTVKEER